MPSNPPNNTFIRPGIDPWNPKSDSRTILDLVEHNAVRNPDHVFAIQLQKDPGSSDSIRRTNITHRSLKQAVLACGERLKRDLSLEYGQDLPEEPAPVALLMESDVCLIVYVFALMWLRIPVVLLSARLSPVAIHHLLLETGSSNIIVSAGLRRRAEACLTISETVVSVRLQDQVPFEDFFPHGKASANEPSLVQNKYPSQKRCLVFHSSGTTGMPKPIHHTDRYFLAFASCHEIGTAPSGPSFSTLPLFHAFGWVPPCLSLSIGMPVCFPPRSTVPNAQAMFEQLSLTKAASLVSVPSILEDFALAPNLVDASLTKLSFVAFGGGRLKETAGRKLASLGVKLLNHFGATETGPLAPLFNPDATYDWHYFRLRSDINVQVLSNGADEDGQERFQLTIRPLGWDHDFQLQDNFVRNPRSQGPDYTATGRKDDVLVLANGEKFQPGIVEAQLIEEPGVKAVVAFGNDQTEVGVLLQPASNIAEEEQVEFIESIWPTIERANRSVEAYAQITSRRSLLVVPHDTVLPRSDKGSILRKDVYAMFAGEIEKVYKSLETLSDGQAVVLRTAFLAEDISKLIHETAHLNVKSEEFTHDDDLFELGLDSLQATQLRRRLQASVKQCEDELLADRMLPLDFVYRFPSVNKMTNALRGDEAQESDLDQLATQFAFNHYDLPVVASHTALVTGATGGLGSNLVAHFARMASVSTVVCLLRPRSGIDARTRLLQVLSEKKIKLNEDELEKLCVMECNTSQSELGLQKPQYQRLLNSVRWIVQAGWPMDFKLRLGSFEESFRTLHNLLALTKGIDMLHGQARTAKFIFISSISTVGNWSEITGEALVSEQFVPQHSCAIDIGYAKAKRVCEIIIERASAVTKEQNSESAMSLQYVRIGQLCGSSQTGIWNQEEHLAALIKSSQVLGALPELHGTLSWIPVDIAAQVVCDIAMSKVNHGKTVYHVENPVRQSWSDMLTSISNLLRPGPDASPLPIWPYKTWVESLRQHHLLDRYAGPATKLVPFFEEYFERMAGEGVTLDTFAARQESPVLRRLKGISEREVSEYIARWRDSGFLV
ncbi:acetyl-CoA synthetase-like protein [Plenodomus tracheiphilus IPT5]|uniref:Acetyl-CoA synthetase-like protein n=1 Tax=Plenodomus tracheiphilus IPT5 TaxID=1408161 RepID=A0A6A7AX05_9PLEO|nr:acetyl-CoA synthetase-like protein [Plenodomus tracheiphilus IPT5]